MRYTKREELELELHGLREECESRSDEIDQMIKNVGYSSAAADELDQLESLIYYAERRIDEIKLILAGDLVQ